MGQVSVFRCETCTEEEMAAGAGPGAGGGGNPSMAVRFYHVAPDCERTVSVHGDPLLLACREGQTLSNAKAVVQERLGVSDEELASWKFYHVRVSASGSSEAVAIDDTDEVVRRFGAWTGTGGADEEFVGMEHTPKPAARAHTVANYNRQGYERPVRIYT